MSGNIVESCKSQGGSAMLKLSFLLTFLALLTVLQGCTTINTEALADAKIEGTNQPSGTFGCIAPKIVTEKGECKEPEKLSWMKR